MVDEGSLVNCRDYCTRNKFPDVKKIRRFVMANAICPPKDTVIYNAMAYYRLSKDDGAGQVSDSISNQRILNRGFWKETKTET